jgi:hypothetical protein
MGKQRSTVNWSACKRAMSDWPRAGVIALVQELYRLSDENRQFLHARLLADQAAQSRDDVRQKVLRLVTPDAVYRGDFSHAAIKRLIDRFEKATDDAAATADLILSDIDASLLTFAQIGDFEPIVDHVYAMMHRLHRVLERLDRDAAAPLVQRLREMANKWGGEFGYGLSDELVSLAAEWERRGAVTRSK